MIEVNFFNDYSDKFLFNQDLTNNLICNVLKSENHKAASISIIFSKRTTLNKLKKEFFNLDHNTDVIAFNLEDDNYPIDGEVYISIYDVKLNSKKYNQTFNEEFKRIIIHGILHLVGYDDITKSDKNIMSNLEEKYLEIDSEELVKL